MCLLCWRLKHGQIPDGPDASSIVLGPPGLRTILDERDSMLIRNGSKCLHVAWLSCQMNRNDGSRARRNASAHGLWIERHGVRVHVCEHWNAVLPQDRKNGAHVRYRRYDELVFRLRVQRGHGKVNCGTPRRTSDGVSGTQPGSKLHFECFDHASAVAGKATRTEGLQHESLFFLTKGAASNCGGNSAGAAVSYAAHRGAQGVQCWLA